MLNPYAKGSFTGNYEPRGVIGGLTPDNTLVVGHAFGVRTDGPGIPNEAIAGYIDEHYANFPIISNHDVAVAQQTKPLAIIEGKPSLSLSGGELGTWGELAEAEKLMGLHGLKQAILVGQAFHIGRIGRQADARKLSVAIPTGLPTDFDPQSTQWWIRSKRLWIARELAAAPKLKYRDHQLL